jgi:transposase
MIFIITFGRIKISNLAISNINSLHVVKFRALVIQALLNSEINRNVASSKLGISTRQLSRIVKRFCSEGESVLVHRLCGKASNNSSNQTVQQQIVNMYQERYAGFNYVHASELMSKFDGITIHHNTLRHYLLNAGITKCKPHRKAYHKQRLPRPRFGELVQFDGSIHDWFADGRLLCLMHMVDDATGTSLAMLFEGETTHAALVMLHTWCTLYGVPESLYTDKDSVYRVNERHILTLNEELDGITEKFTEFGKVCERLAIKIIYANTPQAKGRVERKHAIYQDRLVKEITLMKLDTIEKVNDYLLKPNGFIANINSKFTIPARDNTTQCLRIPPKQLKNYFTIDYTRVLRNDYTIAFKGNIYQLERNTVVNAQSKVTVKIHLDHSMTIHTGKHQLKYQLIENYQRPIITKPITTINKATRTMADTPWRNTVIRRDNSKKPTTAKVLEQMYRNYI